MSLVVTHVSPAPPWSSVRGALRKRFIFSDRFPSVRPDAHRTVRRGPLSPSARSRFRPPPSSSPRRPHGTMSAAAATVAFDNLSAVSGLSGTAGARARLLPRRRPDFYCAFRRRRIISVALPGPGDDPWSSRKSTAVRRRARDTGIISYAPRDPAPKATAIYIYSEISVSST